MIGLILPASSNGQTFSFKPCAMVSPGLWLRRESLAVLSGNRPGVIHTDLAACNAYKDAVARAPSIKCPTVLVLGDGDLM